MRNKFKTFLEPALADKKVLLFTILTWIVIQSFFFINIFLIQKVVEIIESGNRNGAINIAIIFSVVNLINFFIIYLLRNRRWINIYQSCEIYLHKVYMKRFNFINNMAIENFGTGKIISILTNGFDEWSYLINEFIRISVGMFISVIATIFIIIQNGQNYQILFILFILFITTYITIILTTKTKEARKLVVEGDILYSKQIVKIIMGKFEILQNKKIDKEINEVNKYIYLITDSLRGVRFYVAKLVLLPEIIVFLIYLSFLLILVYVSVPFSIIVSFFLVISFLRNMINDFVWFCADFSRKIATIEKLWDFFDNTPEIKGLHTGKQFKYKNGDIELKNISFSYGSNTVFDNFSLKIKGNQIIAFVGESGGGKTTLMKLISGFIEPNSGEIIIDEEKLSKINLMSYYKEIGYLTQDPSVFDGTIIENLTYGAKEEVTENKLREIIKKAKCEFIYDFKNGLNTEIGERGVRLSGGQKQRLAIAKIFLKDPKIIFLDEPTSALDSKSEKLIHESFNELFKGKTIIIIAHRLQTVKSADEIFVIEKGKLIEKGNHKELLNKKGYYSQMIELQSGF